MSFSFNFKLKSHPDKLLYEHLKNVGKLSKEIVLCKEIKNKDVYSEIAYLIGIAHDFAKATTYFQDVLEKRREPTEKAFHGMLSSIFGYYLVGKYLKSKKWDDFNEIPLVAWIVILKHHGNIQDLMGADGELGKLKDLERVRTQIEDIKRNSLEELREIYKYQSMVDVDLEEFFNEFEEVVRELRNKGREFAMSKNIDNYFLILFFYSILLDADKLDASGIGIAIESLPRRRDIPSDLIDRYKEVRFSGSEESDINMVRNEAYEEVTSSLERIDVERDRILSIELPTGCGKTLTAFSFALKLREKVKKELGFKPRIIYSLPFLSIIDQNAEVFSEVLAGIEGISWKELFDMEEEDRSRRLGEISSDLILKHHHLADVVYRIKEEGEEFEMDVEKSLLLIEGWHSEIVVTTFVQFFHSLITNRNRAARKFHNMVNSIIILDEVQSIPYKYWVLVNNALKYLAEEYNCWVVLVTATLPLIFREEKGEIKPLIENKQKYFEKFNRVEYDFNLEEKEFEEFKQEVLDEILESDKDIMVVLNTIESSKDLYSFVKEGLEREYRRGKVTEEGVLEFENLELFNLSTHIIPIHRLERIRRAKEEGERRKVIITTQLIEAGVDISVDLIYRDLAPLDCIIQTAGRCNRNNEEKKGAVKIVNLKDTENNRVFHQIYSSTLIWATRDVTGKGGKFEERDFVTIFLSKYYDHVRERGSIEEPSGKVIEVLESLRFSEISDFRLIDEDYWKMDVFVEVDEEAKQIWSKYEGIMKKEDRFERRREFLKMKKRFYDYVISVDAKKIGAIVTGNVSKYNIGYVSLDDLERKYDLETGFITREREEAMIL